MRKTILGCRKWLLFSDVLVQQQNKEASLVKHEIAERVAIAPPNYCINRSAASEFRMVTFSALRRARLCKALGGFPFLPDRTSGGRVEAMRYQDIITMEPGKRGGKPCIRGMRITVYDVFSYLAGGMTVQQVLEDFPYLTPEDIQACYAFAADRERLSSLAHSETSV